MQSIKLPPLATIKSTIRFLLNWLRTNWTNILLCSLVVYLLVRKNITFQISLNNDYITTAAISKAGKTPVPTKMSLMNPSKVLTKEQQAQVAYIQRFAKVAQREMHKYGIPASIKLAQGLLESKAGNSPLASKNNNHFGIKCFSKKCRKGHCSNFTDDSHKDFFRIYPTAWESYRAHSEFLQNKRYQHLLGESDYKTWAIGLVKAGYATDQEYGKKLIRLIERLELYRYDEVS